MVSSRCWMGVSGAIISGWTTAGRISATCFIAVQQVLSNHAHFPQPSVAWARAYPAPTCGALQALQLLWPFIRPGLASPLTGRVFSQFMALSSSLDQRPCQYFTSPCSRLLVGIGIVQYPLPALQLQAITLGLCFLGPLNIAAVLPE